jgi:Mor family transcriptional regulator
MGKEVWKEERNRKIWDMFFSDGNYNLTDVAKEFNLSVPRISQIINACKRRGFKRNQ